MNRIGSLTLALFLLVASASAFAVEPQSTSQSIREIAPRGITPTFYACVDKASGEIDQAACLTAERKFQDHRLNVIYQALLAKLDAPAQQKLVAAERTWLTLQDQTGALEDAVYGNAQVAGLQVDLNDVFRICERATAMDRYLSVVNDR